MHPATPHPLPTQYSGLLQLRIIPAVDKRSPQNLPSAMSLCDALPQPDAAAAAARPANLNGALRYKLPFTNPRNGHNFKRIVDLEGDVSMPLAPLCSHCLYVCVVRGCDNTDGDADVGLAVVADVDMLMDWEEGEAREEWEPDWDI